MVRARSIAFSRITLILVGALALAGCQVTQGTPSAAGVGASLVAGPGQRVIERDVEAPDVFQVEEAGLWDGRPSLGGVWVAHPDVDDPERAMIRNPATGQEVIGALFRRERENPGPRFQISSEAANALGILPGAPTDIAVTALRLQRVELEVEPAPRPRRHWPSHRSNMRQPRALLATRRPGPQPRRTGRWRSSRKIARVADCSACSAAVSRTPQRPSRNPR